MTEPNWQCPNCDETVDAELTACWQCGCNLNGEIDPDFVPEVYSKLVTNQDQAVCNQCGYMLRGLTEHRCPECGEAFDLVKGDTIPPPKLPDDHPISINRRKYLRIWLFSWIVIPWVFLLTCAIAYVIHLHENYSYVIIILCVITFVTTPVMFALSLLPEHKDKRNIRNR